MEKIIILKKIKLFLAFKPPPPTHKFLAQSAQRFGRLYATYKCTNVLFYYIDNINNLSRFGAIQKIDYKPGDSEAFIQYESIDAAQV